MKVKKRFVVIGLCLTLAMSCNEAKILKNEIQTMKSQLADHKEVKSKLMAKIKELESQVSTMYTKKQCEQKRINSLVSSNSKLKQILLRYKLLAKYDIRDDDNGPFSVIKVITTQGLSKSCIYDANSCEPKTLYIVTSEIGMQTDDYLFSASSGVNWKFVSWEFYGRSSPKFSVILDRTVVENGEKIDQRVKIHYPGPESNQIELSVL